MKKDAMTDRIDVGREGEDKAVSYLKENGYRIVERNFRNKLGEIDIIAVDAGVICFIEVRTRRNVGSHSLAYESVGASKQYQLSKIALSFLKAKKLTERKARFDVVSVSLSDAGDKIGLLKDAFPVVERYA
jgi:putative endonuclease